MDEVDDVVGISIEGVVLIDDDRVFPLGTDTKVLATELFGRPLIYDIAKKHGYDVRESKQTVYPDFTLLRSEDDRQKIAIDVKTTYRKPAIGYTLGSYTSYLRNNTKNIAYPYDQYAIHWVIGFVYTRREQDLGDLRLAQRQKIATCYEDVERFVQEKYKIAGESPGSGNTTNIGSISATTIQPFVDGAGPFAKLGEEVFRAYWAGYGKIRASRDYATVGEFLSLRTPTRR